MKCVAGGGARGLELRTAGVYVIIKAKKHCYIKYNLFVLRVSL